jgi:hypothetical protein
MSDTNSKAISTELQQAQGGQREPGNAAARVSDTPRTDALEVDMSEFSDWGIGPSGFVRVDDARQLERELAAERERCARVADDMCEKCGGEGFTIEPRCCGRAGYECCGDPVPERVQCDEWLHAVSSEIRAHSTASASVSPPENAQAK